MTTARRCAAIISMSYVVIEGLVERVAVIAAIANQPRREIREKRASRVAGTRCGSYGEALATCTATGRPWRSTIAGDGWT
jgi:hypothetical protein